MSLLCATGKAVLPRKEDTEKDSKGHLDASKRQHSWVWKNKHSCRQVLVGSDILERRPPAAVWMRLNINDCQTSKSCLLLTSLQAALLCLKVEFCTGKCQPVFRTLVWLSLTGPAVAQFVCSILGGEWKRQIVVCKNNSWSCSLCWLLLNYAHAIKTKQSNKIRLSQSRTQSLATHLRAAVHCTGGYISLQRKNIVLKIKWQKAKCWTKESSCSQFASGVTFLIKASALGHSFLCTQGATWVPSLS